MNKEQIVDKYMKEVMPMTTKFDYGILKQQLFNLLEYAENKQLILCSVVRSKDVQLMRDSMLKSREETAKAREYSAIKQTLEIYCNDDELPTVNEVLERIGRKH